jgi:hypothetical protein
MTHPQQQLIEVLKWAKAEREDWSERNGDRYWQMCRVVAQLEATLSAGAVPHEPLINTKADVERACRLDARGERDYLAYAAHNLRAAMEKREDAPCASSEHEMAALVALKLERVPTYPEIVQEWAAGAVPQPSQDEQGLAFIRSEAARTAGKGPLGELWAAVLAEAERLHVDRALARAVAVTKPLREKELQAEQIPTGFMETRLRAGAVPQEVVCVSCLQLRTIPTGTICAQCLTNVRAAGAVPQQEPQEMSQSKALAVAALLMAGAVVRIELRKAGNPATDDWWLGHLDSIAILLTRAVPALPAPQEQVEDESCARRPLTAGVDGQDLLRPATGDK